MRSPPLAHKPVVLLWLESSRRELHMTQTVAAGRSAALVRLAFMLLIPFLVLAPSLLVRGQSDSAQEVEIRNYMGEKLNGINGFPENSIAGVQHIDPATYALVIDGLVSSPQAFSYADLEEQTHTEKVVTLHCVEGWSEKILWNGIPLSVLFDQVGPMPQANTVIFYAQDGYSTSLPLQEVLDRGLIIADHMNGLTIRPERGFPFQLVAEDKWGYKWIKWITHVELSSDPTYRGYWESRGYNNNGDLSGSMFAQ